MSDSLVTPWTAAHQCCSSLSQGICSNSCPLSQWWYLTIPSSATPFSIAFNLSLHQGLFQLVAFHIKEPKCDSFSFSVSPSNEYSGLISFNINWFDLLTVQGAVKSLLQHHNSKALILWCSAFFMVQLSHLHMTTGSFFFLILFYF